MPAPYVVHMIAGGVAIVIGFIALFARKGAPLHRRGGTVFMIAMLVLATTGVGIAIYVREIGSVIGGSLAFYLVSTGMITVQPPTIAWKRALVAAMLVAGAVAGVSLVRAVQSLDRTGAAVGYLVFASVSLLALRGDVRVLRHGQRMGAPRLTRHLWRMCMALWMATASFFLGPRVRVEKIIPASLISTPLLVVPVLLVLVTMGYWLWRLRSRAPLRGMIIEEKAS